MRKGFTMLEFIMAVIFVGLLSAVVLPLLCGTAEEAKKAKQAEFRKSA